eukprot:COSAG01_NODE_15311_length_1350_cov_6.521982_1_plen_133_part_10
MAQDLIGPDVKFHHSKLNLKMGGQVGDGGAVRWHQDIQVRARQPVLGTGSTDGMMPVTPTISTPLTTRMDKPRQFWPHSNFTPLTIGLYLHDVDGARDHGGPPAASFLTQISHPCASGDARRWCRRRASSPRW